MCRDGWLAFPSIRRPTHGELKREEWGLLEVPRVESYRGLIFASFDQEAESLDAYLGEMKWYLDVILDRTEGGLVTLPGVHKWTLKGNWKLAAEQFSGDNYHVMAGHESMARLGLFPEGKTSGDEPWTRDFEARTDKGHGWINLAIPDLTGRRRNPRAVSKPGAGRSQTAVTASPERVDRVYTCGNHFSALFGDLV